MCAIRKLIPPKQHCEMPAGSQRVPLSKLQRTHTSFHRDLFFPTAVLLFLINHPQIRPVLEACDLLGTKLATGKYLNTSNLLDHSNNFTMSLVFGRCLCSLFFATVLDASASSICLVYPATKDVATCGPSLPGTASDLCFELRDWPSEW